MRLSLYIHTYNEIYSDNSWFRRTKTILEYSRLTTETGNWTHAVTKRLLHVPRRSSLYQTVIKLYLHPMYLYTIYWTLLISGTHVHYYFGIYTYKMVFGSTNTTRIVFNYTHHIPNLLEAVVLWINFTIICSWTTHYFK